ALSQHSRNRKAGYLLGKGNKIEDIKKEIGMVIEGVENTEVAYKLAKINNIEMPIVNSVYNILYNSLEPKDALNQLMTRKKREE
ncbi:MAG: glycerol-3-phosphate dehydrogenase, partial [Eubacteriales bacterium]|nr:glycerol-3-phosphate dehydrogenase [Eubacteriales bacterium]